MHGGNDSGTLKLLNMTLPVNQTQQHSSTCTGGEWEGRDGQCRFNYGVNMYCVCKAT